MRPPGVKALVIHKEKLLLALRDNLPTIAFPDHWNLPGGGIDEGETEEVAMRRELQEEICVIPADLKKLGLRTVQDGSRVTMFIARLTDDEASHVRLGNEGQKLGYFSVEELRSLKVAGASAVYFSAVEPELLHAIETGDDEPLKRLTK